jgi:SAM-dependent methyltransferase
MTDAQLADHQRMHPEETESHDSSRPKFWDARYATGQTPWDFHGVPAALKAFLKVSPPERVLIPGCGVGYEVRAFHESGWEVSAIDFSRAAVEEALRQLGALARFVLLGDFFTYDFGAQFFDVIYERTFLCALPPDLWPTYVNRVAQLLRPKGKLVGVFLYGEPDEPPPYPLTSQDARKLFERKFSLSKSLSVLDSLPMFAGNERWQEWALNSRAEGASLR